MPLLQAAAAGLVAGVVLYVLLPIILGAVDRDRVPAAHYIGTAMGILGRGLLVKRSNGGYWLKQSVFDATYGKERARINGETRYWEDKKSLMSELYGWPFGLTHEDSGTITNPRFAELGERLVRRARAGRLVYDDGSNEYVAGLIPVAERDDRLVDLDYSLPLMSGDADPGTTEWSKKITKLSQDPFSSGNLVDYVGGLAAFGLPFACAWLASEVTSGGSSGPTINIGMVALGVVV